MHISTKKYLYTVSSCIVLNVRNVGISSCRIAKPILTSLIQQGTKHVWDATNAKDVTSTRQYLIVGRRCRKGDFICSRNGKDFTPRNQNKGGSLPRYTNLTAVLFVGTMNHEFHHERPRNGQCSQKASNGKLVRCGELDSTLGQCRINVRTSHVSKYQNRQPVKTINRSSINESKCLGHDCSLNNKCCWHLRIGNGKGYNQDCNSKNGGQSNRIAGSLSVARKQFSARFSHDIAGCSIDKGTDTNGQHENWNQQRRALRGFRVLGPDFADVDAKRRHRAVRKGERNRRPREVSGEAGMQATPLRLGQLAAKRRGDEAQGVDGRPGDRPLEFESGRHAAGGAVGLRSLDRLHPAPAVAAQAQRHAMRRQPVVVGVEVDRDQPGAPGAAALARGDQRMPGQRDRAVGHDRELEFGFGGNRRSAARPRARRPGTHASSV